MKNSWQIFTILLAAAVVVLVAKDFVMGADAKSKMDPRDAAIENIMTRSSVRAYTDEAVSHADIDVMLKAGMAAPTGGNRQPWEFVVINDRNILDQIPNYIGAAKMAAKAPLAIAVCGVPAKSFNEYWIQDCSAATENILLAAHAIGLGAVWCGAYPENDSKRTANISKLLQLPEGVLPLSIIVIGHPSGEPTIKDKWDPAKVHYNKF